MKIEIRDNSGNRHYGNMRYLFKRNRFAIKLDSALASATSKEEVYGATQEECKLAFQAVINEWQAASVKKRKVITYEFEASERANPDFDSDGHKNKDDLNGDYWSPRDVGWHGLKFRFNVGMLYEYEHRSALQDAAGKELTVMNNIMDWTEEREAFCQSIEDGLDKLVARAGAILDMKVDKIQTLIDSGKGAKLVEWRPKK